MANYGRNFEFLAAPHARERKGRFFNDEGASIPIGAPVLASGGASNALDMAPVALATTAQDRPAAGQGGIAVFEYAPNAFAGDDPVLTVYSDKDTIDDQAAIQLVSGTNIKVRFRNTPASSTFLNTRDYVGRVMVDGINLATPTVIVGDFLTPGVGDDTSGYWAETSTASEAWLVVTKVDADRDECEAQMAF